MTDYPGPPSSTDYPEPPPSSYQPGPYQSAPGQLPADQSGGSTADVARDQAAAVGQTASEAGSRVTQTAADQAREVASETARQARDLLGEAGGQVRDQTSVQQQKAASQLHSVADELHEMVAKGGQSGMATEVAHQAAERLHGAASWLEQREPADVLQAVRDFARRRPGMFLAGAVAAGLAAGRLTRGMTDASRSGDQDQDTRRPPRALAPSTGVVTPGAAPDEPYYPAAGVPGPGVTGLDEEIVPGRFQDSDYPAGGYPPSDYPADEYPASDYPASDYPASDYPASSPETYRPGQRP
jgi:hypothetical protein